MAPARPVRGDEMSWKIWVLVAIVATVVALAAVAGWLLFKRPLAVFAWQGRAALKKHLARNTRIEVSTLPYNLPLLEWLTGQKAANRQLLLVTAADQSLALTYDGAST